MSTTDVEIERAKRRIESSRKGLGQAIPPAVFLVVFFILPLFFVLFLSFLSRGATPSDYRLPITIANYTAIFKDPIRTIMVDTLRISFLTTLVCFLIGYPLAFFISTRRKTWVRNFALFLVILPFWTNFLVRTYAWQIILGRRGIFNEAMLDLGLIEKPWVILGTETAVILGLVYGFLPFMVLPIYAVVERFNFRLVEAGHDLSGNDIRVFWRIILPITMPGVVAGWILVFIPTIGAFVTPALLGGTKGFMIGNLINRQFKDAGGSWTLGSGSSIVMMLIVAVALLVYLRFSSEGTLARAKKETWFSRLPEGGKWALRALVLVAFILAWQVVNASLPPQELGAEGWWAEILRPTLNTSLTLFGLGAGLVALYMAMTLPLPRFAPRLGITANPPALTGAKVAPTTFEISRLTIWRDMAIRRLGSILLWLNALGAYIFLWVPIILLVAWSFNDSRRSGGTWEGFSTQWYERIFEGVAGAGASEFSTGQMLDSLRVSLIIGVAATLLATFLGTLMALAMVRGRFRGKQLLDGLVYLPVMIPEITLGVALLIFFKIFFDILESITGMRYYPGMWTVIIAHVSFSLSFVAVVVRARLQDMNPRYEEAARDLGANEFNTFRRITFPLLLPGIIAGALLAFTLSLDDFVITFFVGGGTTTTLTVYVWGLVRRGVSPEINAVSTLMIIASTLIIGLSLLLQGRNASKHA